MTHHDAIRFRLLVGALLQQLGWCRMEDGSDRCDSCDVIHQDGTECRCPCHEAKRALDETKGRAATPPPVATVEPVSDDECDALAESCYENLRPNVRCATNTAVNRYTIRAAFDRWRKGETR